MPKLTTEPYRTLPQVDAPVFCKDCIHRERRTPIAPVPYPNGSTSTGPHDFCRHADRTHAHPVSGERVVDVETLCTAKNDKLDCSDFTPPPLSWWARTFGPTKHRRKV